MDLYIDEPNLCSFIRAKNEVSEDEYEECNRLLRRQMHLIFNFSKERCKEDPRLQSWFLGRGNTGRGKSEEVDEFRAKKFPERPIKVNFRNNMEWKVFSSMFLVDEDDEKIDSLKNTRSMLVGKVGEEVSLLLNLFCNDSYDLHSIYNIRDKSIFPGWDVLKKDGHIMPCSDIVIADRYLFDDELSEDLLDKNLLSLLRLFAEEKKSSKVNIVFFTDEVEEVIRAKRKKQVESFFGKRSGTKVTFVMYNYERPHDRFILTNYRIFRSGDSFNNYFDAKGNLKSKGLTLDVDSLANNNVCSVVESIRIWLQSICDNNQDRIFGDKSSNFIKFR